MCKAGEVDSRMGEKLAANPRRTRAAQCGRVVAPSGAASAHKDAVWRSARPIVAGYRYTAKLWDVTPPTPLDQLQSALAGRYAVEREIGAGGMATVYLARDLKHNRRVALKVLKPELGAVLGVERYLSEIQVTANLQHPNLLPLFDSGEANGLLCYVMPFVEGASLRARLDC